MVNKLLTVNEFITSDQFSRDLRSRTFLQLRTHKTQIICRYCNCRDDIVRSNPSLERFQYSSESSPILQSNFYCLLSKSSRFIIPSHRGNKIRILVKTRTHWERFNLKLEFMIKVGVTLFKITSAKLCAFSLFGLYPHLIRFNVIG